MKVSDLWKGSFAIKAALIVLCYMIFSFGNTLLYSILGILLLCGGCYMAFREGCGAGHAAMSISAEIESVQNNPNRAAQIDGDMLARRYSVSHGVAGILAGGLLDYIVNSFYIAVMLIGASEGVLFVSRFCSFSVSLPLWSIVSFWQTEYTTLGPDVVVMLLAGPFLIPAFQFLGYIQGPRLWKNTEQAMAAGRRRAKARSRIAQRKPQQPKIRKPEI